MKKKLFTITLIICVQIVCALIYKLINKDYNILEDLIIGLSTGIVVNLAIIKGQSNFNKNKIED
ncbi:hypothetical protein [Mesoflavibacter zeaxanthinifaciens]|uniref:hypothetical protein n=1 Tax=Mesoflavibacter zeaxanthinifaciens TaxID=393060 RepID=UPI0026EE9B1E|nr:hypothetical protein [Mesoflavibacter zeaxanthinifaciens]